VFYLFHWFRSFLPAHNPIGFGAADFIELALAAGLVAMLTGWSAVTRMASRLAQHTGWNMLIAGALPIVLRLALLPGHPIPSPHVSDDFSYILLGDTLAHFRFANPVHPMHRFFETYYVLQEPSYSSIYPMAQGFALAFGKLVFGHMWAGVALSIGAFCALCYWMLRGWTTPEWSLFGAVLAGLQFGPLNQWMNSYWGGAMAAAAGCLVFGALPRLREHGRARDAALLGAGLGIHALARPFETIFLFLAAAIFLLPAWRSMLRPAMIVFLAALPGVALTLAQNRAATGIFRTLPYMLSRYQYGVPATFTFQSNAVPHRELTREQELAWKIQSSVHDRDTYFARLAGRVRFYRFFFLAPLYLALPAFLFTLGDPRSRWMLATIAIFAFGTAVYPYFYSHYIAALTCLFVLISILALDRLARWNKLAARLIISLCVVHFAFWFGLHASANPNLESAMWDYESWDAINHGDPDGRLAINRQLDAEPGRQLVFVRYSSRHDIKEWVFNAADIDRARVVWGRDLGLEENEKLRAYYPDRKPWLLEADARPPRLAPYVQPATPAIQTEAPKPPPKNPPTHPNLKFEEVK
jgi:hypothetical protein